MKATVYAVTNCPDYGECHAEVYATPEECAASFGIALDGVSHRYSEETGHVQEWWVHHVDGPTWFNRFQVYKFEIDVPNPAVYIVKNYEDIEGVFLALEDAIASLEGQMETNIVYRHNAEMEQMEMWLPASAYSMARWVYWCDIKRMEVK